MSTQIALGPNETGVRGSSSPNGGPASCKPMRSANAGRYTRCAPRSLEARLARDDYSQEGGLVGQAVGRGEDGPVRPGLQGMRGVDSYGDGRLAAHGRRHRGRGDAEREV